MESSIFGTEVIFHIKGGFVPPETMVVIGMPDYSTGYDDVVMLANENCLGMPCNAAHITNTGEHRAECARVYYHRYIREVSTKITVKENERLWQR